MTSARGPATCPEWTVAGQVFHVLGLEHQLTRLGQQHPAGVSEVHAPADTFKKFYFQFLFQALDSLTDGRLGEVEMLCGSGVAALVGDGQKGLERGKFHRLFRLGTWIQLVSAT